MGDPMFEPGLYAQRQRRILECAREVVRVLESELAHAEAPTMWIDDVATTEGALIVALMQAHGWEREGMAAIRLAQKRIYGPQGNDR
jgi:hypothetical protein